MVLGVVFVVVDDDGGGFILFLTWLTLTVLQTSTQTHTTQGFSRILAYILFLST